MKTVCLALLLASTAAVGQSPAPPAVVRAAGAFFALSVANAESSAQWYKELLNLNVAMNLPKRDGVRVIVLEGEGLIVELIEQHDAVPLAKVLPSADPLRVHGIVKAGVIVDDFDKLMARIREQKVQIAAGPFPKRNSQRANVIVKDNAGNMIQFFGR